MLCRSECRKRGVRRLSELRSDGTLGDDDLSDEEDDAEDIEGF